MNKLQFNHAISVAVAEAVNDGVAKKQMDMLDVIGVLEMQKLAIVRNFQDAVAAAHYAANEKKIILPPNRQ